MLNKEFFKRWSSLANIISVVLAAVMTYSNGVIPETYHSYVMMACGVSIAVCQAIKQEAK